MKKSLPCLLFISFMFILFINPASASKGAADGILLCGNVIIPSLFPFTVCVLFLMRCANASSSRIEKVTKKLFGFNSAEFICFLFSFLGGYPIGAKLLNELVSDGKTTHKRAAVMLNYCVNAGPAFIVIFIGSGLLKSTKAGYMLLASNIFTSVLMALLSKKHLKDNVTIQKNTSKTIPLEDNFVLSVSNAATTVFTICAYVIFFSTVCNVLENIEYLSYAKYILEVTVGICQTKNIYLISFLLSFSGISIWCQILSVTDKIRFNFIIFVACRILHGAISVLSTYLLLKLFPVLLDTAAGVKFSFYSTSKSVSLSLVITAIIFIISVTTKNKCRNILSDLV